MPKFAHFWTTRINFLVLVKLPVPYFGCVDFKSDICFRKSRAQIPKFEHSGPKSINFLILTKFCWCNISKGWFQISLSLSMVISSLLPSLHEPIQCLCFTTYLENDFSFFRKNLKIWPQLLFFEVLKLLIADMTSK